MRAKKLSTFQVWTAFILCCIWILGGTLFYALYDEFGWMKGFYYAVSIGFCMVICFRNQQHILRIICH